MKSDSTKPAGSTSYKQTAFGIIPREKLLPLEVEGTKRGLEYIHDLVSSDKTVRISSKVIRDIHAVAFQWIFPDWAGAFRTIQVTYSNVVAPNYFQVPELIVNLCDDLEAQLSNLPDARETGYIDRVVEMLAWFQHRFVCIHPFQDYNGRVARMLTILLLLKLGLPAVEIHVDSPADREKYLVSMQHGDAGDLSHLEKLISAALSEALGK